MVSYCLDVQKILTNTKLIQKFVSLFIKLLLIEMVDSDRKSTASQNYQIIKIIHNNSRVRYRSSTKSRYNRLFNIIDY